MSQQYENKIGAKAQLLIYDCREPQPLADFYARLLGGQIEEDPFGGHLVTVPELGIQLGFQEDEYYEAPVWLGQVGDQQPMLHLDIVVADQQKAVDYAVSIGAVIPDKQFCQPEWDVQWITLLDPAGHPFCFFEEN